MLAVAALHLSGNSSGNEAWLERADSYIRGQGGVAGLRRRYGRDKTFAVPILTNCALAGMVDWQDVSALPFELACFPQTMYRLLRLPVVSYAIPALVAIGQCRHVHCKPRNPLLRIVRDLASEPSLEVLRRMQPDSGGYLEAVPLTSFVVMSMTAIGRGDHSVAKKGVDFLVASVRLDGSWPIDTNLATWNTTLAVNALAEAGEEITELVDLDWLLACQHTQRHPYTGAEPGGWGWSDLSGAVPDADDTPGALLALAAWLRGRSPMPARKRVKESALIGLRWLLRLQNSDGGWPTFCRGWGKLPFDRSGADLTAHALRAIVAWHPILTELGPECRRAVQSGLAYLERCQQRDGSWLPLWFGNQDHPGEENPVYGTARVLLAYRDLALLETSQARRGVHWLFDNQNTDGGWGGGPSCDGSERGEWSSSTEETGLAVCALASVPEKNQRAGALDAGIRWLVQAVETDVFRRPAPIGFYFSKLWYYEKLYPVIFSLAALGQVLQRRGLSLEPTSQTARQKS
jgi:squalene-hopene/tetraprenyl-beta-curcumene cyclase